MINLMSRLNGVTHLFPAAATILIAAGVFAGPGGGDDGDSPGGGGGGSGDEATPFYVIEEVRAVVMGDARIEWGAPYPEGFAGDSFAFGYAQGSEVGVPFTGMHVYGALEYYDFYHLSTTRMHADTWAHPIASGAHIESNAFARAETYGPASLTETSAGYFTWVVLKVTVNANTRVSLSSFLDIPDGGNHPAEYDVSFWMHEYGSDDVFDYRCSNMNNYSTNCHKLHSNILTESFVVAPGTYTINIAASGDVEPRVSNEEVYSEVKAHLSVDATFQLVQRRADLNGDNKVNGADMAYVLAAWNSSDASADLDENGVVNGGDLAIVLSEWD